MSVLLPINLLNMKSIIHHILISSFTIIILSCDSEETQPTPDPITVSFDEILNGAVSIAENALPAETFALQLSGPVPADGLILCTFPDERFPDRFNTVPGANRFEGGLVIAEIPLKQGQTEAELRFGPNDNMVADGDISVKLTLVADNQQPVAIPGSNSELVVTIVDDEVPIPIGFDARTNTDIKKSDGSVSFAVDASDFVKLDGSAQVKITSTNAVYGTHYTINPDGASGSFELEYPRGHTNNVFILKILPEATFSEPLIISFELTDHKGGVIPSEDASYLNEIIVTISPD